jgi:hypothetical protein
MEELRYIFYLPTRLPRPRIGTLDFWGRLPLDGMQCRCQSNLQVQVLAVPVASVRQGLEDLLLLGEMRHGFQIR